MRLVGPGEVVRLTGSKRIKPAEEVDPLDVAMRHATTLPRKKPGRRVKGKQPVKGDDSTEASDAVDSEDFSEASAELVVGQPVTTVPEAPPAPVVSRLPMRWAWPRWTSYTLAGRRAGCAAQRSRLPWAVFIGNGTYAGHTHTFTQLVLIGSTPLQLSKHMI